MVRATWLSSTAGRWVLKSNPARGTLPWTNATTADPSVVVVATIGAARMPATNGPPASSAGTTTVLSLPNSTAELPNGQRDPVETRRRSSPAPKPVSTTAAVSSGAPPIAASGRNIPLAWPNATRPHGKPPKGARPISASAATHTPAAHNGAAGSRDTTATPAPASASTSASTVASASHGSGPTNSPAHDSSGTKKPSP